MRLLNNDLKEKTGAYIVLPSPPTSHDQNNVPNSYTTCVV